MAEDNKIAYAQLIAGLMLADGKVTVGESMFLSEMMTRMGMERSQHRRVLMTSGGLGMIPQAVALLDEQQRLTISDDLEGAANADGRKGADEQAFIDMVALTLVD